LDSLTTHVGTSLTIYTIMTTRDVANIGSKSQETWLYRVKIIDGLAFTFAPLFFSKINSIHNGVLLGFLDPKAFYSFRSTAL